MFFIFLFPKIKIKPVPKRRTPAKRKSNNFQFTSLVNCIAIKGMSNRITTMSSSFFKMISCLLIYCFNSYLFSQA